MNKLNKIQRKKLILATEGVVIGLLMDMIVSATIHPFVLALSILSLVFYVFMVTRNIMSDE